MFKFPLYWAKYMYNCMFSCMNGGLNKTLISIAFILTISEKVLEKQWRSLLFLSAVVSVLRGQCWERRLFIFAETVQANSTQVSYMSQISSFFMSPEQFERQNCCKLRDLFLYRA